MRLMILSFVLFGVSCARSPIIQKTESKEGVSVVYVTNNDTFALDYLTRKEYDSLVLSLAAKRPFLYNAYSPLYDEYFVIKSDRELKAKDIVWFDDNAAVVDYPTPYVAKIISPYKAN